MYALNSTFTSPKDLPLEVSDHSKRGDSAFVGIVFTNYQKHEMHFKVSLEDKLVCDLKNQSEGLLLENVRVCFAKGATIHHLSNPFGAVFDPSSRVVVIGKYGLQGGMLASRGMLDLPIVALENLATRKEEVENFLKKVDDLPKSENSLILKEDLICLTQHVPPVIESQVKDLQNLIVTNILKIQEEKERLSRVKLAVEKMLTQILYFSGELGRVVN